MTMGQLILLRHGQSEWNKENRFTGWVDVGLSPKGKEEAESAGRALRDYQIDHVFTSVLKRAIHTADLALAAAGKKGLIYKENQALNERHYGDLQGLNKDDMREKYGAEQVHIWRRSFDVRPPNGESLKDTCERVLPYFKTEILPLLQAGENVLIAAHGNSLRALIMFLENLSEDEIVQVEIPTGKPIVYRLNQEGMLISKEVL